MTAPLAFHTNPITMNSRLSITISLLVGALALAGLGALVYSAPPSNALTALALLLVLLAVTGLTAPFWRLLLRRILSKRTDREITGMGLRFGLWSGVFATGVILLQVLGFMNQVLILALLALLIMIEMLFQQNADAKRPSRKTRR